MDAIDSPGRWWLPESPEHQVDGHLSYTPGRSVKLVTYGTLQEGQPLNHFGRHEYVHGYAGNKIVTLRATAQCSGHHSQPGGVSTATYDALRVYTGAHLAPDNSTGFSVWHCDLTHFQTWLGESGFDDANTFGSGENQVSITLTVLEDVPLFADPSFEIVASFLADGPNLEYTNRERCVRQIARLTIRPTEPQPEQFFWNILNRFSHLLTLLIGRPVKTMAIQARSPSFAVELGDETVQTAIGIGRLQRITDKDRRYLHAEQMPLPRSAITDQIQQIAAQYFTIEPTIRPALNLFIENEFSTSSIPDVQFLNAVRAIETFHRRTSDETDLPEGEHAQRLEQVLHGCPEQYETWLQQRLGFSNELTLRRRIRGLVDAIPEIHPILPGGRSAFINRVVNARNYLTHFSVELESSQLEGADLYTTTEFLELILAVSILRTIGVDSSLAWNAYQNRIHNILTAEMVTIDG